MEMDYASIPVARPGDLVEEGDDVAAHQRSPEDVVVRQVAEPLRAEKVGDASTGQLRKHRFCPG